MSNDAISAASAAALLKDLKDLRAQRAAINGNIAKIEAFLGPVAMEQAEQPRKKAPPELAALDTGDACVWLLRQRGIGARMTTREIADGLEELGYKKRKPKTTNQISVALNHRLKKADVKRDADGLHWVYVGVALATKPTPPPAPVAVAQPQQPIKPAAPPQPPQPAAAPQKGTPSSANGVAASGLR